MAELWWIVPGLMVLGLAIWAGHRALMSADGSGAGVADAFGNFVDVFEPARARAARDLKDHENVGPVIPSPDDDDDDDIRLIRDPTARPPRYASAGRGSRSGARRIRSD
jgi:hypothetical protein